MPHTQYTFSPSLTITSGYHSVRRDTLRNSPEDCNIHKNIVMDTQFTKKNVVEMYRTLLGGGRSTIIAKCEIVKSGEIEI